MGELADGQAFDLYAAPVSRDRTEAWDYVRTAGDVFPTTSGAWCVTGLESVKYVIHHPELFSNSPASEMEHCPVDLIPVAYDPPKHRRYRAPLNPAFAPRALQGIDDELRRQAAELIESFAGSGRCEVVEQLARPFPAQVFLTMLGLPLADRDRLIGWVRGINGTDPSGSDEDKEHLAVAASEAMSSYLSSAIAAKRVEPGDDLISFVLGFPADEAWTEAEVLGFCYQFTLAGLDTIAATTSMIMRHLATHPELRKLIVDDPDKIEPFIEEFMRIETIVPFIYRRAVCDVEIGGRTIPEGALVLVGLATVNRDETLFPDPAEFVLDRAESHYTFGAGIHRCIGSHLARRELRIILEEFHRIIPEYTLAAEPPSELDWPSLFLAPAHVPLVFEPVQPGKA